MPALALVILFGGIAATLAPEPVIPQAKPPPRATRSQLQLFSGPVHEAWLRGNRVTCLTSRHGEACYNHWRGAVWPKGTYNSYVFNSGLQLAGIVGPEGGPWAGDTASAWFFDASGIRPSGEGRTLIYLSTDPESLDLWPDDARIPDNGIYDPALVGRKAISDEDSWVRYWDGAPSRNTDRAHPIGIEVTQRTHAWNWPHGNQDILYYVFDVKNVTHEPEFQLPNEARFFAGENALPDAGWPIEEFHVAFAADFDVGDARSNMGTAILPFDLFVGYQGGFDAPEFEYPPEIFAPPFFVDAPGLVGAAWLATAEGEVGDRGVTLYSGTENGGAFGDPRTDRQLWRYLSGHLDPDEDPECNVAPQVATTDPATTERSVCYVAQRAFDWRGYSSTGPFRLGAGESVALVFAFVYAGTVETMPDGTPSGILAHADENANPPGIPSFHSGYASARGCDPSGLSCDEVLSAPENAVKPIERAAGWAAYHGPAPAGRAAGALEGPENRLPLLDQAGRSYFELVPSSLLWKTVLARAVVDGGFALLPRPPEPPTFALVPGDGTVTVTWEPSATENDGDPFWEHASDPTSPFHNPNYRLNDVQMYRIWKRVAGEDSLRVVAEFPVPDRPFLDYTCETVEPDQDVGARRVLVSGDTVAVEGFATGEICPLGSEPIVRDSSIRFNNGAAGDLPGAGVTREAQSLLAVATSPVLAPGFEFGCNGCSVPFLWTDPEPLALNFVHEYAVTAVDLNSAYSGPVSMESERLPQAIVPRGVASADRKVHTVPDPYLGSSAYDLSPLRRVLQFVNLPPRATIRIYSLSGHLVRQLDHDDPTGGGRYGWDLRDQQNFHVSSGVYFFHVIDPDGREQMGKFTVIMGRTWQ